jgi:hypothetical protein
MIILLPTKFTAPFRLVAKRVQICILAAAAAGAYSDDGGCEEERAARRGDGAFLVPVTRGGTITNRKNLNLRKEFKSGSTLK